ncbi:MAG: alpha-amylase family glycosyl hydrolase [Anaeromyxobacter sp.]
MGGLCRRGRRRDPSQTAGSAVLPACPSARPSSSPASPCCAPAAAATAPTRSRRRRRPAITAPAPPRRRRSGGTARWSTRIWVRSFRDSDGNGVGDLRGITASLDYLNDGDPGTDGDLGVDAIWLSPIHPSPSNHGYDVTDYDGVNPAYGTEQDFDELVAAAHARGLKVVLDFVPNHVSSLHPWFQSAVSSVDSPYRDWFLWRESDPGWTQPWSSTRTWHQRGGAWYYGVFWSEMPDLDWTNPAVADALADAAEGWLARGVDGFRLDAVRYLVETGGGQQADQPGTHAALKGFADRVRAVRPDALLVGEAWTETDRIAAYFGDTVALPGGDELGLNFDFPLQGAIGNGVASGSGEGIAWVLDDVASHYPAGAGDAPFLSNHDVGRASTGLSTAQKRVALGILLTSQGTPTLYYGDELGLPNGTSSCSGDLCYRTPMHWNGTAPRGGFTTGTPWVPLAPGLATINVATESADPTSLLSRSRQLIRLRAGSPALQRGTTTVLESGGGPVLALLRTLDGEAVLVVHNLGATAATAALPTLTGAPEPLLVDDGATVTPGAEAWSVSLPATSTGVWRLAQE